MQLAGNAKCSTSLPPGSNYQPYKAQLAKQKLVVCICNFEEVVLNIIVCIGHKNPGSTISYNNWAYCSAAQRYDALLFPPFQNNDPKIYNPATSQPRQGSQQKNQQHILYSYINVQPLLTQYNS